MKYILMTLLVGQIAHAFDCKIIVRNPKQKSETTYDFNPRLERKELEIKDILPIKCEVNIFSVKDSIKFAVATSCSTSEKASSDSFMTSVSGAIGENNQPVSMVITHKKIMVEIETRCK